MQAPYINIHSHNPIPAPYKGIESIHIHNITNEINFPTSYSIGLHPWFLQNKNVDTMLNILNSVAENSNVKAIGECGIDRVISINIELQKEIFVFQLELAERLGKAIIVHNVRAFSDMLEILKEIKPSIPIIFHAFSGNEEIINKLKHYNVYFSFGHNLLNEKSKASRVISKIPRNCLFLETDDWDGSIEEIYNIAAKRLNISIIELRNQIYYTYKNLFL